MHGGAPGKFLALWAIIGHYAVNICLCLQCIEWLGY